jgi:flagellar hook-basal body complex protein FliE
MLSEAVMHANATGVSAEHAVQAFAAGARDDIHGTMIAVKEAEIELKLVSNVRTKLVEAFNDLWRMSV